MTPSVMSSLGRVFKRVIRDIWRAAALYVLYRLSQGHSVLGHVCRSFVCLVRSCTTPGIWTRCDCLLLIRFVNRIRLPSDTLRSRTDTQRALLRGWFIVQTDEGGLHRGTIRLSVFPPRWPESGLPGGRNKADSVTSISNPLGCETWKAGRTFGPGFVDGGSEKNKGSNGRGQAGEVDPSHRGSCALGGSQTEGILLVRYLYDKRGG